MPGPRVVFGTALIAAVGVQVGPPIWPGVASAALLAVTAVVRLLRISGSPGWRVRHQIAVARAGRLGVGGVATVVIGGRDEGRAR